MITDIQQKLVDTIDSLPIVDKFIAEYDVLSKADSNDIYNTEQCGGYQSKYLLLGDIMEVPAFIHNGYVYTYDVDLWGYPYGFKVLPEVYEAKNLSEDFGDI